MHLLALIITVLCLSFTSFGCFYKHTSGNPQRKGDDYARWYYCFDGSMNHAYIHEFAIGVGDYNENTNIRWLHSCDPSTDYHTIKADGNFFQSWSKTVSILDNFGRLYSKATHEMGHAVGFCHEHKRPDREHHSSDLNCGDHHYTRAQSGSQTDRISSSDWYNRASVNGYQYDCKSIMHYWKDLGSGVNLYTDPGDGETDDIGGYELSWSDKIQINDIYSGRSSKRQYLTNNMPDGEYAYLMPRSGCPDGFEDSIVYFDDEDDNNANQHHSDFFDYVAGYQDAPGGGTLLYFCISRNSGNSFAEACSDGYFKQIGDTPGWGSVNGVGGGRGVTTCAQCASLCSSDSQCQSYECSPSELKCNLNLAADPTQGANKDYMFCTKEETCPVGYFKQMGDIPNWGSVNGVGGGRSVTSCTECANLCSADSQCQSYECSSTERKCNLNEEADPTRVPSKDYMFCTKEGASCSGDYFQQIGDIPGWGSVNGIGGGRSVSSCAECANLCSADSQCQSYECSPSERKCNLNSQINPTQALRGAYNDYMFCTKRGTWPKGSYCILSTNGQCPSGFSLGIRYSDNEDDDNHNDAYGSYTPYQALYGQHNSRMHYCCRTDGSASTSINLFRNSVDGPDAFTLYRKGGTCQNINFYTSQSVWIFEDDEDSDNNNQIVNSQNLPDGTYDRNTKYYVCVYVKHGETIEIFQYKDLHNDKYIDLHKPELYPNEFPNEFPNEPNYTVVIVGNVLLSIVVGSVVSICLLYCLCKCGNMRKNQFKQLKTMDDFREDTEEENELIKNAVYK